MVHKRRNTFTDEPLQLNDQRRTSSSHEDSTRTPKKIKMEHEAQPKTQSNEQIRSPPAVRIPCNNCGGSHREATDICPFVKHKHPHVNNNKNIPWTQSEFYHLYNKHPWESKYGLQRRLRHDHTLQLKAGTNVYEYKSGIGMPSAQRTPNGNNYISNMSCYTFLSTIFRVKPINTPFLTFSILPNSTRFGESSKTQGKEQVQKYINQHDKKTLQAQACLIDTGAVDCSYISSNLAKSIQTLGYTILSSNQDPSVQTPFSNGELFPTY